MARGPRATALIGLLLLVLLAGCGGEDEETPAPPTPASSSAEGRDSNGPEILVAALGDSITAGNPGFDPDPGLRAAGYGTNERSQYEYWAALADERLRFRNCGVAGERTEEIELRLEECATGADVLVVQGGVNDIAQSLAGEAVDRIAAVDDAAENLEDMVIAGKELGLDVELVDVLPWNNGHPYATPLIQRLNEEIERIGAEQRVPVLPFHDVLDDPANPGLMKPEWTAEGDHPSVEGYRRLGELAFRLP